MMAKGPVLELRISPELRETFERVEHKLNQIIERISVLEARVRKADRTADQFDQTIDRESRRLDSVATRLEHRLDDVSVAGDTRRNYLAERISSLEGDVRTLEARVDGG